MIANKYPHIEDLPFKDFTFKCIDGEVKAHRCILWGRCSFFKTTAWNIDGMTTLDVGHDMKITQKVVDFFYGRVSIDYPFIDFEAYILINMLYPSSDNISLLVPDDMELWNNTLELKDEFKSVGISYDQLTSHIAELAIYNNVYEPMKVLPDLHIDILRKIFASDISDWDLLDILTYSGFSNEVLNELGDYIKLEYITYSMYYESVPIFRDKTAKVTRDTIRQSILYPTDRYKYIADAVYTTVKSSYLGNELIVLNKKYSIPDLFTKEEYDMILTRDRKTD